MVGLGEIGFPIFRLIKKNFPVIGFDKNKELIPKAKKTMDEYDTRFLHICIPFGDEFSHEITRLIDKFVPLGIVIHSTVSPNTTSQLQKSVNLPIIYSPIRGVHKKMIKDLRSYVKFFAVSKDAPKKEYVVSQYKSLMKKCGIRTKQVSEPVTLELSKIVCDTSYYGWLINYSQISKMIADGYNVDYDEMWSFADEIQKRLGNRPKMFPGFIGGHCVIPNLKLINDKKLNQIDSLNELFKRFLESTKR